MKISNAGGFEFENVVTGPDATADGHLVNRQTGDGRYVLRALPECELNFEITVAMPTDARLLFLPRPSFYEYGMGCITLWEVGGVDRTAYKGVEWDEMKRNTPVSETNVGYGGYGLGSQADVGPYVSTIESACWALQRLAGYRAAATVKVGWVERLILENPLRARAVRVNPLSPGTLDTSVNYVESWDKGGGGAGANTNALIVDHCPAGYQIEVWYLQKRKGRLGQARSWLPWRRWATNSAYALFSPYDLDFSLKTRFGFAAALYNPVTGARSRLKAIGFTKAGAQVGAGHDDQVARGWYETNLQ